VRARIVDLYKKYVQIFTGKLSLKLSLKDMYLALKVKKKGHTRLMDGRQINLGLMLRMCSQRFKDSISCIQNTKPLSEHSVILYYDWFVHLNPDRN